VKRDGADPCGKPALVLRESLDKYVHALLVIEAEAREMSPDDHAEILPSVPATPDLSDAESALRAAELARVEFAADTRAKELLGDVAWYQGLEARAREVDEAQRVYEEALAAAAPERVTPKSEEIAAAPLAKLPGYLEQLGLVVRVAPGRGQLEKRVSLEPRDLVTP
jgi:hypothetical protein